MSRLNTISPSISWWILSRTPVSWAKALSVGFMKLLWNHAELHYTMFVSPHYPPMCIYHSTGRCGRSVLLDAPWSLPQTSCFHNWYEWRDCAVYVSLKSTFWDEAVCSHDEGMWLLPSFIPLTNMFAELPREGHLSVRGGSLDSFCIFMYPPFHRKCLWLYFLNVFPELHWTNAGWQWLCFLLACIHTAHSRWLPHINIHPQMHVEYMQALNMASYCEIRLKCPNRWFFF